MHFASRISLNFENNKVQRPFTPVLRIAMPLFDADNDLFGLLVLNSSAKQLIELLDSDTGEYYLTDHQGHYIYGPDTVFHYTRDLARPRMFDDDFKLHSTAKGVLMGYISTAQIPFRSPYSKSSIVVIRAPVMRCLSRQLRFRNRPQHC
ncbi:hypothetical protein AC626_25730 [Pseudoalteromonas rubra]|uniref:Cache domain-containing protein n=1 Tax=Pseudoalteromonas rubra TaxID=43658 RepID=A0A0L0EM73_9GAMM|nr:hypothetical protein AC626_25730 [Pseudoalteromonas rubra]